MNEAERLRKREESRDVRQCQKWRPQEAKNENIEKIVAILVNQKSYCVTSCVTKDMLRYLVWVMNFKFVWRSHIKTQLNQSINQNERAGWREPELQRKSFPPTILKVPRQLHLLAKRYISRCLSYTLRAVHKFLHAWRGFSSTRIYPHPFVTFTFPRVSARHAVFYCCLLTFGVFWARVTLDFAARDCITLESFLRFTPPPLVTQFMNGTLDKYMIGPWATPPWCR